MLLPQVGLIQWSSSNRMRVYSNLTSDVSKVTDDLELVRTSQLQGGTYFVQPLNECKRQMDVHGRSGSYKLCVLITDGDNSDREEGLTTAGSMIRDGYNIKGVFVGTNLQYAQVLFVATSCAFSVADSPASRHPECNITTKCAEIDIPGKVCGPATFLQPIYPDEAAFSNCTRGCNLYTKADNMEDLAKSAGKIAGDITTNVGSVTSVDSATNVVSNEVEYTSADYFWFLLFAIPFLLHLFYKPIEFKIRQQCRKHGKCLPKKRLVKRKVMKRVPSTSTIGAKARADGTAIGGEDGSGGGGGGGTDGDTAADKQKKFKWKVTSSDRYLWSTSSGGAAPMDVNFGSKLPPSAPGGGRQTQTVLVEVEVESWEDPEGTEAWENTFEAVYNGGAWQEWVSRRICGCCWETIDAAQEEREGGAGGSEQTSAGGASAVAAWQDRAATPSDRAAAAIVGVEMQVQASRPGSRRGEGGDAAMAAAAGAGDEVAVRVNPFKSPTQRMAQDNPFGGTGEGGGEEGGGGGQELVTNFDRNEETL